MCVVLSITFPGGPGIPAGPTGPCSPLSPFGPCVPILPSGPGIPCRPCGPGGQSHFDCCCGNGSKSAIMFVLNYKQN